MPVPQTTILSWSSGKDSAWALHQLRQDRNCLPQALLTTFNRVFSRVAMHAVREELVEAQADAAGLPLIRVDLPWPCSNQQYEEIFLSQLDRLEAQGQWVMAFGDLFLEDVRNYRERLFSGRRMTTRYPLWGKATDSLAREMIEGGLKAILTCVDLSRLSAEFAGRSFDSRLLEELPPGIDPCGENGEFHTFCWDAPPFRHPLRVRTGEIVERDGFAFCDLLLDP